ncbi:MAG: phytanoyl-CoA dioxygenase family protein [Chloroflexota bacterium]
MPQYSDVPFVLNKDLGRPQLPSDDAYCRTNSEGLAVTDLTVEQKYAFDLRGWLLVPGVLTEEEMEPMRAHIKQLHTDPESIPEKDRSSLGGPCEKLIDHPVVVAFMNEFVYNPFTDGSKTPPLGNQNCYGFRMEYSFSQYRQRGEGHFAPHNGGGLMRVPGDHHTYHAFPGHAKSVLTRALWELNPVQGDEGGTLFVSGSHKSAFPSPEAEIRRRESPFWESYSCPAGSVLFFTEAVTHSSSVWTDETPRLGIFNSYNMIGCKWHNWDPHPDLVEQMPPMRQTLFRPVYVSGNVVG